MNLSRITQSTNQPINQSIKTNMNNDTIYYNNVKFTGRAIDSPGEVITTLLYFAVLILMALNAWPNLNLD